MKFPEVGWVVNIFVVAGEVRGCGLEGQAACDVEVVVHAEAPIFFDQAKSPFIKIRGLIQVKVEKCNYCNLPCDALYRVKVSVRHTSHVPRKVVMIQEVA